MGKERDMTSKIVVPTMLKSEFDALRYGDNVVHRGKTWTKIGDRTDGRAVFALAGDNNRSKPNWVILMHSDCSQFSYRWEYR